MPAAGLPTRQTAGPSSAAMPWWQRQQHGVTLFVVSNHNDAIACQRSSTSAKITASLGNANVCRTPCYQSHLRRPAPGKAGLGVCSCWCRPGPPSENGCSSSSSSSSSSRLGFGAPRQQGSDNAAPLFFRSTGPGSCTAFWQPLVTRGSGGG